MTAMEPDARRLIVNADDYGRSPAISAGIRRAHQQGIVTSTTVMINFPGAAEDVRRAVHECPDLGVGVHLCLTAGRPVLPPEEIPSLVDPDGAFPLRSKQLARLGEMAADEIHAELRAQIEATRGSANVRIDHLDSHHHVTYMHPRLLAVMLELAAAYQLSVRSPLPRGGLPAAKAAGLAPPGVTQEQADQVEAMVSGTPHPAAFSASFFGARATLEQMLQILDDLPAGATEIMCHPGLSETKSASSYNTEREQELEILCHPAVRERVVERGIELVSFRFLTGAGGGHGSTGR